MNTRQVALVASLAALILVAGCAQEKTRYGDAKGVETLTNQYGSTDLQIMASRWRAPCCKLR